MNIGSAQGCPTLCVPEAKTSARLPLAIGRTMLRAVPRSVRARVNVRLQLVKIH